MVYRVHAYKSSFVIKNTTGVHHLYNIRIPVTWIPALQTSPSWKQIARYSTLIAAPSICRNDILLFCAIGTIAAIAR
jgi:hypothetical protein